MLMLFTGNSIASRNIAEKLVEKQGFAALEDGCGLPDAESRMRNAACWEQEGFHP